MDGNVAASIDRRKYAPAYAQLARILRQRIASGEFRPGDRLPSESELCSQYGVSPMTVRRSINLLVDQGLVETVQGLGTFARPVELGAATFDLEDLQAALSADRVAVRVLEASIRSADERVARKLAVGVGQRVIFVRRQILQGEEPFLYHWNPRPYIIIGGGQIDDEICRYVGADAWRLDAVDGVHLCQRLMEERRERPAAR